MNDPMDKLVADAMAVFHPDYEPPAPPPPATLDDVLAVLRRILAEVEALRSDVAL